VARAIVGQRIDRAAMITGGFRFAGVDRLSDPRFLPGGAKYGDLPGLIALGSPHPVWIDGEPLTDDWIDGFYAAEGATAQVHRATSGEGPWQWLMQSSSSCTDGRRP
jgi:hypothetical protein